MSSDIPAPKSPKAVSPSAPLSLWKRLSRSQRTQINKTYDIGDSKSSGGRSWRRTWPRLPMLSGRSKSDFCDTTTTDDHWKEYKAADNRRDEENNVVGLPRTAGAADLLPNITVTLCESSQVHEDPESAGSRCELRTTGNKVYLTSDGYGPSRRFSNESQHSAAHSVDSGICEARNCGSTAMYECVSDQKDEVFEDDPPHQPPHPHHHHQYMQLPQSESSAMSPPPSSCYHPKTNCTAQVNHRHKLPTATATTYHSSNHGNQNSTDERTTSTSSTDSSYKEGSTDFNFNRQNVRHSGHYDNCDDLNTCPTKTRILAGEEILLNAR